MLDTLVFKRLLMLTYMDFVESIVEKYPTRYLEVAHVHYYDNVLKSYPEVKSDQELMCMFEKHSEDKGGADIHCILAFL